MISEFNDIFILIFNFITFMWLIYLARRHEYMIQVMWTRHEAEEEHLE